MSLCIDTPLILLVGNSGAGKDSLIRETIRFWPSAAPSLVAARRFITRPPHASEAFHPVTDAQFERMKRRNYFCLSWRSYGLQYGVPLEVLEWQRQGSLVMVNVSRQVLAYARANLANVKVVFIRVPLAVSLARIDQRGRESAGTQTHHQRVERAKANQEWPGADLTIDNSGSLAQSARRLRDYLLSLCILQQIQPHSACGSLPSDP